MVSDAPIPSDTGRRGSNGCAVSALLATGLVSGEIELAGKRYMTPDRFAGLLGVTVRTLARWHRARLGPPRTKVGRLVLISVEKLPEWIESHETGLIRGRQR